MKISSLSSTVRSFARSCSCITGSELLKCDTRWLVAKTVRVATDVYLSIEETTAD